MLSIICTLGGGRISSLDSGRFVSGTWSVPLDSLSPAAWSVSGLSSGVGCRTASRADISRELSFFELISDSDGSSDSKFDLVWSADTSEDEGPGSDRVFEVECGIL